MAGMAERGIRDLWGWQGVGWSFLET